MLIPSEVSHLNMRDRFRWVEAREISLILSLQSTLTSLSRIDRSELRDRLNQLVAAVEKQATRAILDKVQINTYEGDLSNTQLFKNNVHFIITNWEFRSPELLEDNIIPVVYLYVLSVISQMAESSRVFGAFIPNPGESVYCARYMTFIHEDTLKKEPEIFSRCTQSLF
tara:strand:+ start:279 stop:785 length:507 start_codon:yes stop_codon:yes gene_type:complete